MKTFNDALAFAEAAHMGQFRKTGKDKGSHYEKDMGIIQC